MYSWLNDDLKAAIEDLHYFESFAYNGLTAKSKTVKKTVFKNNFALDK